MFKVALLRVVICLNQKNPRTSCTDMIASYTTTTKTLIMVTVVVACKKVIPSSGTDMSF